MDNGRIITLNERQLRDIVEDCVHEIMEGWYRRKMKPKTKNNNRGQLYRLSLDGDVRKFPTYTREEGIRMADMYIDNGYENVRLVPVE